MAKNKLINKKKDSKPKANGRIKPSRKNGKVSSTKKTSSGSKKSLLAFFKDPKVKNILGMALMVVATFVFLSCMSYLLTGKHDLRLIEDAQANPLETYQNTMGKLGALTGWFLMNQYFGIAAILIPFVVFLIGLKMTFNKVILPLKKTTRLAAFGLFVVPLIIGFFTHKRIDPNSEILEIASNDNLVGAYGHEATKFSLLNLGKVGTFLFILLVVAAVVIYNFPKALSYLKNKLSLATAFGSSVIEDEEETIQEQEVKKNNKTNGFSKENDDNLDLDIQASEDEIPQVKTHIGATDDDILDDIIGQNSTSDTLEMDIVDSALDLTTTDTAVAPPPAKIAAEEALKIDTVIAVEEKKLDEDELDDKVKEFGLYDPMLDLSNYELPHIDFLIDYGSGQVTINRDELEANKNKIVTTLQNYKIEISKIKATIGPTITLYEVVPAPGVRISKIKNLEDDIALSLAALGIRIIAPMPGKGTIGIEVPNSKPQIVAMKTLIASEKFQNNDMELPCALGKTISNETLVEDLAKMPHLLMAGATGQGKSVGLNAILVSLLYKKHPAQIKFILVDPKKVELTLYNKIERHYLAKLPDEEECIITDTHKVVRTLNSLCIEMDNRYDLLKKGLCRNIIEYNAKFIQRKLNPENGHQYLPYIVLVVDEFADLIMTAGKEVETPIARLAQLARAIGIHLIVATQRPSVNIITGTIKANFPARIAFRVTSKIDSRTILDGGGADQLIGRGDMLFTKGNDMVRLQCGFVDTPEVEEICEYIGSQQAYPHAFHLPEYIDEKSEGVGDIADEDRDSMFEDAAKIVVLHQQGSASLLQRKLKLGYNRAGRIIDQLEAAGVIGPFKGSKARDVLVPDELSLEQLLRSGSQDNF